MKTVRIPRNRSKQLAREAIGYLGLDPIRLEFWRNARRGHARRDSRRITLPGWIFMRCWTYVRYYILHEVAHFASSSGRPHGPEFKAVEDDLLAHFGLSVNRIGAYATVVRLNGIGICDGTGNKIGKEVIEMGDKKHYVFSARTTEEGLKMLNDLKARLNISWDELIVPAINRAYDVSIPMVPRAPVDETKAAAKAQREQEKAEKKAAAEKAKAAKVKEAAKKKAKADKVKADKEAAKTAKAEAKAKKAIEDAPSATETAEAGQEALDALQNE